MFSSFVVILSYSALVPVQVFKAVVLSELSITPTVCNSSLEFFVIVLLSKSGADLISILPEPNILSWFIVLIFVPLTNVSCLAFNAFCKSFWLDSVPVILPQLVLVWVLLMVSPSIFIPVPAVSLFCFLSSSVDRVVESTFCLTLFLNSLV